jgi:hemoglobin
MARTIFDRYGGFSKVSKIVISLYDKVIDSPIASPYFQNTNMKRLIDHQTQFISSLMGGPASFTDEHIERVHAHLGINEAAFNEVVYLLTETLEDHGMDDADIAEVQNEFLKRKNHIIQKA